MRPSVRCLAVADKMLALLGLLVAAEAATSRAAADVEKNRPVTKVPLAYYAFRMEFVCRHSIGASERRTDTTRGS